MRTGVSALALPLLALLVVLDGAGAGFRATAGRSARIDKRRMYAGALVRGALFGLTVDAVALVAGLASHRLEPSFWRTAALLAVQANTVYVPVGAVVVVLAVLRAVPSVDLRSASSSLVFGPLTLLRPAIVLAGALPAFMAGGAYAGIGAAMVAAMLCAERGLRQGMPPPDA